MKKKYIVISFVLIIFILIFSLSKFNRSAVTLDYLTQDAINIQKSETTEVIAYKNGIGTQSGSGGYKYYWVILLIKSDLSEDKIRRDIYNIDNMAFSNNSFWYLTLVILLEKMNLNIF